MQSLGICLLAISALATDALGSGVAAENAVAGQPRTPDATITMTGGVVAAGVGYDWGRGILTYQGHEYSFCIRGLSVGELGIAHLKASGAVFDLKATEDFAGRYFALSTGAAIARGGGTTLLKNDRGVTMELQARVVGLRLTLSASGMRIVLAGQRGCAASPAGPTAEPSPSR